MDNAWDGIADHVGHGLIVKKNYPTFSKVTVGGSKTKNSPVMCYC